MYKLKNIVVIGSTNMDIVVEAKRRPEVGETLFAERMFHSPGGKGGNQAVAAAKTGSKVYMVGCVGDDIYGRQLIKNYEEQGVDTKYIKKLKDVETGCAVITLAEKDNSILLVKGANDSVDNQVVDEAKEIIQKADLVILQNEIPVEAVKYVIDLCDKLSVDVLYNPAPMIDIEDEYLDKVRFITPNETESKMLFGDEPKEKLMDRYPEKLIITLGSKGVEFSDGKNIVDVKAYNVEVLDTTGAGDTFNGAFATYIAEGKSMDESLKFANAAAALSVQKKGAQGGMPNRKDVEKFLEEDI